MLYIDCRWHHDLNRALFDTAAFRAWREEQAPLWLVLDSLDEYPAGPAAAAAKIIGELWSGPVEALRLRVACRTAEWPGVLDQQLPRLWESVGKDAPEDDKPVAFYALAPLRKVDVDEAVKGDASGFFAEVERVRAEPLAIKPITLSFLLTEYGKHRKLPPTSVELYEKGCAILCEEGSRSREGSGRKGTLSAAQRLAIASRIAAVSILCRRSFIYLGPDVGTVPPETSLLDELSGGTEPSRSGEVAVNDAALQEVLEVSGLFAPRGADLMGWAHQTYAEFLAARRWAAGFQCWGERGRVGGGGFGLGGRARGWVARVARLSGKGCEWATRGSG